MPRCGRGSRDRGQFDEGTARLSGVTDGRLRTIGHRKAGDHHLVASWQKAGIASLNVFVLFLLQTCVASIAAIGARNAEAFLLVTKAVGDGAFFGGFVLTMICFAAGSSIIDILAFEMEVRAETRIYLI